MKTSRPRSSPKQAKRRAKASLGRVVALTGAKTFVGRHLIALMERDPAYHKVIALDLEMPHVTTAKTTFYRTDLTLPTVDAELAEILEREGVDTFLHLAFLQKPSHDSAWAHELENIGTMYVLNACGEAKTRKLILWSTTMVYGADPLNPNYLTEAQPLGHRARSRFIQDKLEAEQQTRRFVRENPDRVVTVLRPCTVLGPSFDSYATRFFGRRVVPTLMGFDPLVQFLHEDDLIAAFKLALDKDRGGEFNLVGDGVMALSTVFKLTGALTVPMPHFLAYPALNALWTAQLTEAPPTLLDFLRYLCVADGQKAKRELGFVPQYSSKDTLVEFIQSQRLRRIRLPLEMTGDIA